MIAHGRDGSIKRRVPICLCGMQGQRDETHDAYYCPESGVWLEDKCGDIDCRQCMTRSFIKELNNG